MSVTEEHFTGLDPRPGPVSLQSCPAIRDPAYVIWYEEYFFTGWSIGRFSNTGILYAHLFKAFDICGHQLPNLSGINMTTFAFGGNTTCSPFETCPTPDQWLKQARDKARPFNLPTPGTLQFIAEWLIRIGNRA